MADKRIDELEAAASVTANDLFVLEQAGVAKKLTSFILEQWLLALAQGHGGITSIAKTRSTGTNPVVDTYTITFSDASTTTFTVTNGRKGDTGAKTYVYIKYSNRNPIADSDLTDTPSAWMGICATTAATAPTTYGSYSWYEIKGANTYIKYSNREPIADSDLTDTPSAWMGICSTTASTAPTTYGSYSWYEIKGAKGDPGNDITIASTSVMYQSWTSGTQYPTGTWLNNPPAVTPGNYLWTRTIVNYSDGGQTVSYSSARWGMDGSGAVGSVNSQLPDPNGNVTLTASDVGALPESYQPPVTSVNGYTGTVALSSSDVKSQFGFAMSSGLSTAGWYRVMSVACLNANESKGSLGFMCDIGIARRSSTKPAEDHKITLMSSNSEDFVFRGELSHSGFNLVDKIRVTYDGSYYTYVDIHYTAQGSAGSNDTSVYINPYIMPTRQWRVEPKNLASVNDAPTGETIAHTYTFSLERPVRTQLHSGKVTSGTITCTETLDTFDDIMFVYRTNTQYCSQVFPGSQIANGRTIQAHLESDNATYRSDCSVSIGSDLKTLTVGAVSNDANWLLGVYAIYGIRY